MPKIVEEIPQWRAEAIKVATDSYPAMVEVQAVCLGGLGFHPSLDVSKKFNGCQAITHIGTGWAVLRVNTEKDAAMMIEDLVLHNGSAFDKKDKASVEALTPAWVRRWIKECYRQLKHLDPKPFME